MKAPRDRADWSGIVLESVNVGAHPCDRLKLDGYQYVNEQELALAKLLKRMGIPFTPDVRIVLDVPPDARGERGSAQRIYVPDFIFDKTAYLWWGIGGRQVIHGLEAKRAVSGHFPARAIQNIDLLAAQRNVRVKLLSGAQIMRFAAKGALPMEPLER